MRPTKELQLRSAGSVPSLGALPRCANYELDDPAPVRAGSSGGSRPQLVVVRHTAGLASRANQTYQLPGPPFPCTESTTSLSSTHTSVGWTVGAGVEWKLTPVWSVKAEYLYAELGSQNNTIVYTYGPFTSSLTSTVQREKDNIVRFGVNYKLF